MDLFRATLEDLKSNFRLIHALPNAGPIDAYANGQLIARGLEFGKYTPYYPIDSGSYEIDLYPSGLYDNPVLSKTINLLPNSSSTISVITNNNVMDLFLLNDSSSGSLSTSFLRFINLSQSSPLLTLALSNDTSLFSNVEYLETTGYYPLSPGIYNFRVTILSAQAVSKFISELRLLNGKFYTIYIIGSATGTPQLGYLVLTDGV